MTTANRTTQFLEPAFYHAFNLGVTINLAPVDRTVEDDLFLDSLEKYNRSLAEQLGISLDSKDEVYTLMDRLTNKYKKDN